MDTEPADTEGWLYLYVMVKHNEWFEAYVL